MAGDELIEVIDPTVRPFSRIAPVRSMRPGASLDGAVWRESRNLVAREGRLRPRPGIVTVGGSAVPTYQPDYVVTTGTNKEFPLFLHSGTLTGALDSVSRATVTVLVTTRQAYIYNRAASAWVNVTPTYTAGTIAVTNGSPTVVGTGTLWSTRYISAGQHIKIGSTWYQISAVGSDTSITLTSNFAGTTASGLSYTIRRTWRGSDSDTLDQYGLVHCTIFNDNLYIAGTYLGSADTSLRPAVIKVANILSATPTTTYITSDVDLAAGLDNITDLTEITGIQVLQDGRVVLSGNRSTIFYSSLLSDTVWTASPAGRTVVVGQQNGINALGRLGNNLTIHYDTGISIAYPTGQQDPPLSFQSSSASAGCVSPRTLRDYGGVELFVGDSGQVFAFDGTTSHAIGDEVAYYLTASNDRNQRLQLGAYFSPRWNEYGVFSLNTSTPNLLIYQVDRGAWWVCQTPCPVGAVSGVDHFSQTTIRDRYGVLGTLSRDGSSGGEPGNLKDMLWSLDVTLVDTITAYTNYTQSGGTGYVTTDDLDFNDPLTLKSISRVVCWFLGSSATTENVSVEASRDGGATWVGPLTKSITYSTTDETVVQFCFDPLASETWRVRVTCGYSGILTRVQVFALPAALKEVVEL